MKHLRSYFFILILLSIDSITAAASGNVYQPAYNSPYSNPNNSSSSPNGIGIDIGIGGIDIGVQIGGGRGGGQGGNGVPLDGGTWILLIAGACFGAFKILSIKKLIGSKA